MKYIYSLFLLLFFFSSCKDLECEQSQVSGENTTIVSEETASAEACEKKEEKEQSGKFYQSGEASYYGPGFHGKLTASGETFNQNALTAAHKHLPFNTKVKVTSDERSIIVRINDRGPYAHGRIIDLSQGAAQQLGITDAGKANVTLEVL